MGNEEQVNILLFEKPKKQTVKEIENERAEVNRLICEIRESRKYENEVYPKPYEPLEKPGKLWSKMTYKEYQQHVYGGLKEGEEPLAPQAPANYPVSGRKSTRKSQLRSITEIQTQKTAVEKIGYKVGTQGYPENVEAFEREVQRQDGSSEYPACQERW